MKKSIFIIVQCIIFISLYGCQSSKKNINNDGNYSSSSQITSSTESLEIEGHCEIIYMTFEELLSLSTDVVIATYQDSISKEGYLEQRFIINERLLGEDKGEEIRIYNPAYQTSVVDTELSYNYTDIKYQKGTKYLLVLERIVSVYKDDTYLLLGNIYVPYEKVENSTIYGETLQNHSNLKLNSDIFDIKYLKNYIIENTKNNTVLFYGNDYIRSDKLEDIISGSSYLVKVKIGDPSFTQASDRKTYECEIIQTLKGNLPNKIINITFLNNTVIIGSEYIVAVEESGNSGYKYFRISSKNSVFEISKTDEITALLN